MRIGYVARMVKMRRP